MATRTRQDVWRIDEWDPILVWYARAVREMQKRPIADPTSWRYQAAIHEYRQQLDPLRRPGDKLPSNADQRRFWSQCQHNSWYFLPWHRWYLYYFEEIVAKTVTQLGGPADWALPYWNYSDPTNPDARALAPEFWAETMPDGSPNALRVENRNFGNDGAPVGDEADVDLTCLTEPDYVADPTGGSPGFGGPRTRFNHSGGPVGALEITPHGSMHVAVGGWLGRFNTAGLDPLFWLHHCNIDRLWVVWRKMDPQHVDPTEAAWLGMSFEYHDASGAVVSKNVGDAVDTTALGYEYAVTSNPFLPPGEEGLESIEIRREPEMAKRIPEMVGANEGPVPLTTQPTSTEVPVTAPTGPGLEGLESVGGVPVEPARVYINIENITGQGHPRRYSVFINDVFAGILPLFGVEEATNETNEHPGGGLQYRLDATKAVAQLQAEGNWDPSTYKVTFVPDDKQIGLESISAEPEPQFQIGRVSVYVA